MKHMDSIQPGQQQSRMVFSAAGTAWMIGWCLQKNAHDLSTLLLVLLSGTVIFLWTLCDYRAGHGDQMANASISARRLMSFGSAASCGMLMEALLCVAGLLFNLVFILDLIGYPDWFPESAMLLMAAACLSMGKMLRHRPHYLTGSALIVAVLVYSSIAAGRPDHAASCFAAGAVLWISALYGLCIEHFYSRRALPVRRQPLILSLH
ncbi:MAG: hypothetical protein RXR20_06915 [Paraburkholderia sp.]|jgi:hypothetical protein|uniref:hypothetical protein n=1 Tax=Burkholderiaceae TaxID=119060 RepID=UPI0010F905F9|nr:hypothetical protein [Burkholderia sp. 4M9327F10]